MFTFLKKEQQREDDNLPFKAKLGSLVSIKASPLIKAKMDDSIVPYISGESLTNLPITAISRIRLNFLTGLKVFRFYLDKGDVSDSSESFIQVTCDLDLNPKEILLFFKVARLFPQSREEIDAYLGNDQSGLGARSFDLWSGELSDSLKSATVSLFDKEELITYNRDIGDDEEFIPPMKGSEERIDSIDGSEGIKQSIVFMPYSRRLGQSSTFEQLLISTEILESVNGSSKNKSIHVDIMAGIPLEPTQVTIL